MFVEFHLWNDGSLFAVNLRNVKEFGEEVKVLSSGEEETCTIIRFYQGDDLFVSEDFLTTFRRLNLAHRGIGNDI